MTLGEERVYEPEAKDLVIFTFGNGVPMSLRAAREIEKTQGRKMRVVDLRWLQPLNAAAIARHAGECARIVIVDEGRHSAGVGEGVITAIVEGWSRRQTAASASSVRIPTRRWRARRFWCCPARRISLPPQKNLARCQSDTCIGVACALRWLRRFPALPRLLWSVSADWPKLQPQ